MPLRVEFSREQFKRGSRNFTLVTGIIGLTNLPDMTSPLTCGRHLSKFEKNGGQCRLRRQNSVGFRFELVVELCHEMLMMDMMENYELEYL